MNNLQSCAVRDRTGEIRYVLERKAVKNINLRVRRDGTVYVSAAPSVPEERINSFVCSNVSFIRKAREKFSRRTSESSAPKRYVSGETFYLAGRALRLKVEKGRKNSITSDGVYILLQAREPGDSDSRRRLVEKYLEKQYRELFSGVLKEAYPVFAKYGVPFPVLRLRKMKTKWGTCLPQKGIITLNTLLARLPRNCIEYVTVHELCHFIYANHSRQFYALLTAIQPDWRQRKKLLEESVPFTAD